MGGAEKKMEWVETEWRFKEDMERASRVGSEKKNLKKFSEFVISAINYISELENTFAEFHKSLNNLIDNAFGKDGIIAKSIHDISSLVSSLDEQIDYVRRNLSDVIGSTNKEMERETKDIENWIDEMKNLSDMNKVMAINTLIRSVKIGEEGNALIVIASEVGRASAEILSILTSLEKSLTSFKNISNEFSTNVNEMLSDIDAKIEEEMRHIWDVIKRFSDMRENIMGEMEKMKEYMENIKQLLSEIIVDVQYEDIIRQNYNRLIHLKDKFKENITEVNRFYDDASINLAQMLDKLYIIEGICENIIKFEREIYTLSNEVMDKLANELGRILSIVEKYNSELKRIIADYFGEGGEMHKVKNLLLEVRERSFRIFSDMKKIMDEISKDFDILLSISKNEIMKSEDIQRVSKTIDVLGLNAQIEAERISHIDEGFKTIAEDIRDMSSQAGKIGERMRSFFSKFIDYMGKAVDMCENLSAKLSNVEKSIDDIAEFSENQLEQSFSTVRNMISKYMEETEELSGQIEGMISEIQSMLQSIKEFRYGIESYEKEKGTIKEKIEKLESFLIERGMRPEEIEKIADEAKEKLKDELGEDTGIIEGGAGEVELW